MGMFFLFQVKNHVWVFVNALIENPTFDSQTKENMTLQTKSFGSKCVLSEKFIRAVSLPPISICDEPDLEDPKLFVLMF